MDIVIEKLKEDFLLKNIQEFLDIIKDDPAEYWQEEHFKKTLPGKYEFSFIAHVQKQLAGYIIASQKQDIAHIHKFMVKPGFRSMGIGNALQKEFELHAKLLGIQKITLTVVSSNNAAINFYRNHGYTIEGLRDDAVTHQVLYQMSKLPE